MNTSKIFYPVLGATVLAAAYFWIDHRPGLVQVDAGVAGPAAIESAHDSSSGRALNRYRSVLVARHLDAWEARRQLELRERTLSSLVAVQGGTIRLGAAHYTRTRDTAEFEIRQEISVSLPTSLDWVQLRQDLLRMSRYAP